jgi:general secretion pathway protein J
MSKPEKKYVPQYPAAKKRKGNYPCISGWANAHPGLNPCRQSAGFTLVEILIAIFIFAVVVATVFGSFNFVFGNVNHIEESMNAYEMARDCFNRMTADLQALHVTKQPAYRPPSEMDGESDPFRLVGEATTSEGVDFGRLRFTSRAHLPMGRDKRSGIAEIIYYVELQSDGSHVLKRSDRIDFLEENEEESNDPILSENITALTFTYIDDEGEEADTWDSDSEEYSYATPRAIRIQLQIGTAESSHFLQTMVALPQYREKIETRR